MQAGQGRATRQDPARPRAPRPGQGALRVASVLALAPSPRQGRARAALGRRHRLQPIHRRRTQRSKADPHGPRCTAPHERRVNCVRLKAWGVGQGPLRSRFRNPAGRSAPGDRIRPVRRRTRAPVRSASDLRRRTGEIRTDWRPAGADTDRHGNPAGIRSSVQRFRTTGGCPILRNVGATRHGPDPPSRGSGRRLARPATPCCGRRRRRHRRPAVHGPGRPAETEVPTPIHAVIPDR